MIIKSSTALCNDYSMISDLAHEKAEQREETLKLRAKLEAAEASRLSGAPRNPENGWRRSISVANLVILEPAQRELEEIAQLHLNLVGANSARNITNLILDSRLELFPLSGHIPQDKELRNGGYRYVIAGKYICVYRLIAEMVYVYHIAHGASNYPTLFKRLLKEENQ